MDYSSVDDELDLNDFYGQTPPRTTILRKNRERKQKSKETGTAAPSRKVHVPKHPLNRRSTVSNMYDDIMEKADNLGTGAPDHAKRKNKRQRKLLRGSERDLKLDIASAQALVAAKPKPDFKTLNSFHEEDQQPLVHTPFPQYIESCKRFMSLSCRTIPCVSLRLNGEKSRVLAADSATGECPQLRVDFYNTLSLLIRMGGGGDKQLQERNPRRAISREEHLWQNELKDLIWLELQAFHADRTPMEEDTYLCEAREGVEPLLRDIMSYCFKRHSRCFSTQNSDSGVEDDCSGCLSMYCQPCIDAQNDALRDIEELMNRLEHVEALFPSSKAFAELYPLYSSAEFVGRVKAISLWYNMTKHQRLKLLILGKLMALLENRYCVWPLIDSRISGTDCSYSPSDSNNSTSSTNEFLSEDKNRLDVYNVTPLAMLIDRKSGNVSPYRKYIENILKTRTLNKSLRFLDKLHLYVLRKAHLTLEKPDNEEIFTKLCFENEDEELQRYGCWSPEAIALGLPSYRASFMFLAAVPIEVIHEFLILRLEQKPEKPSPLSVRQLMRELKEGLNIATIQKEKILKYIDSAVVGTNECASVYKDKLKDYDKCMLRVFSDYLDYLEQWALLHHETFQKDLLEEEWFFSCKIINFIPGGSELLGQKFSIILSTILKSTGERLKNRIEELISSIPKKNDDNMIKQILFTICREMQSLFNEEREMSIKTIAFCKIVFKHELPNVSLNSLLNAIVLMKCTIPKAIGRVQIIFDYTNLMSLDELEKNSLISRIREILMQGYRFGFEFYKEMSDSIPSDCREKLARSMISFASLWMAFVTQRCERGRGMRPRWAFQGLEFLLAVCEPRNTKYLTEEEFEDLKKDMDICISHVIGTTGPPTPDSGLNSGSPRLSLDHIRARSRGSSPNPRPAYKSQRSSRKASVEQQGSPGIDQTDCRKNERSHVKIVLPPTTHAERCMEAVECLENEIDERLKKQELIGRVITCRNNIENETHIKKKLVTFTWQRGIKIGQGRFGKVYTAVNNKTGEMMAVKEIPIQPNDNLTIRRVAEEMKILEGINHVNLVRYYGVEVHKNEMLIFMEFCAEGTLENLVAASEHGLPELLVRRYAFQLVTGVGVLHEHGVVHRDIKTANIFLTDGGNCLKIGDFGCAAKIKSHTTMPGELQGFVGTQAYMAPEVFTKNMSEGHGRAADIWSVGCVVVEMASGQRPWVQYDSNYQIMFKVGMGQSPDPPDNMIEEGLEFLDLCFRHDPKDRATAQQLLDHNFVKVGDD